LAFLKVKAVSSHYASSKKGSGSCGRKPFVDVLYLTIWVMAQEAARLAVLSAVQCSF